jgi:hypothetical protein
VDQTLLVLFLIGAASFGLLAVLAIMGKTRERDAAALESPYGVSTEGSKLCPTCGMGNLWTDRTCVSCGTRLKG